MAKYEKPKDPTPRPAPVTPESAAVKQKGQQVLTAQQNKQGRLQTMKGSFGGLFGKKTGDV